MGMILSAMVIFLPGFAFAAPHTFEELAGRMVQILNAGIGMAIVLGLVFYFYGITSSLTQLKSGGMEKLRTHLLWGLLAIFVMVSVWGILAVLRNTLFNGSGAGASLRGGGAPTILCESATDCLIID